MIVISFFARPSDCSSGFACSGLPIGRSEQPCAPFAGLSSSAVCGAVSAPGISTSQYGPTPPKRGGLQGNLIESPSKIGKFLISPLVRHDGSGRYVASVSIRNGRGSQSHDRILRFVPRFDSPEQAARFAVDQATAWIGRPALAMPFPLN